MASQLREVLDRFSEQSVPISINRMAREMALDPAILHHMIDYWVRKGKLREVNNVENCHTCGSKAACPFIVALPRYYERVQEGDAPSGPPCACGDKCTI
ncbi:hypothetical protein G4Y79_12370 [Phototrophicus methaneseepsis]|uniref:Transcriptional regulator HTH-type FeoC domain-containing protein n=1 Tax=Phototrophicus methaneseepsis TaxID=2710758 RepID=A0A7S8E532_9CHLR|nr:FeoC-like transcriptional regulator [Phototrophicus methaneseepsis]QPC80512.1 hypothetical protein G4Y79_12370 [Phototrophicus methaneseepsis]